MFRWGVENELVDAHTLAGLQAVAGLKAGRTSAPDLPKRKPVPQDDIDAVKAVVRQRTRDLIDLQLMTAARSGELLRLTTSMIDRTGDVWTAKIVDHKMVHHGGDRTLYQGNRTSDL
jgi:integrase